MTKQEKQVLNLIINGLPSIQQKDLKKKIKNTSFKPYYKWITFNTYKTGKSLHEIDVF